MQIYLGATIKNSSANLERQSKIRLFLGSLFQEQLFSLITCDTWSKVLEVRYKTCLQVLSEWILYQIRCLHLTLRITGGFKLFEFGCESGLLLEKSPYSELVWSAFSRIWTEYGQILRITPYSVRMRENTDQNNSKYGHY